MKHSQSLIGGLPIPIGVVTQAGDTVEANRALIELAERCRERPQIAEMFGAAFLRVLSRAWIERHIQSTAPLVVGPEPRPTYRLSFMSTGDEKTLGVALQEVTAELDCRRMLSERDRDFAVLRDIGVGLSSMLEIDALAERTYEATRSAIPCKSIYVAIYERESGQVTFPRYMEEGEWKEMTTRPFGNGLTEHLLRIGQPLLLNENVLEQARALGLEPVGRPCQAWLGAPMVVEGEAIGVIALQDYEASGVYDQHDLEVLTIIAALAAAGIKNARSIVAERHAYRELAEAQARLLETERLRGVTETVGTLNHEVNNPLAAIAGNAQLLLKKPEGIPSAALQKIDLIHDAARRIQRVTTKMASLIQACSVTYPGDDVIIDVAKSVAREGAEGSPPADPAGPDPGEEAAPAHGLPIPPNVASR